MPDKASFEDNIKKLDEIVKVLERGDLPLDDMIKLFEEGVKISKICKQTLDEAEQKVNVLLLGEETSKTEDLK